MIGQILKTSIRYLLRNRLFTALNILGLTIGISSCWIIYSIVSYELSYEKDFPKKEQTYRLLSQIQIGEGKEPKLNSGVSRPIYFALREEVTGAERVVPVFREWILSVIIPNDDKHPERIVEFDIEKGEDRVMATDAAYFDMVPYRWLAGHKANALQHPHDVVLTEKRAKLYFPDLAPKDIIGKTIVYPETRYEEEPVQKTISGIVADLSFPSEFTGQEFILLQKRERDTRLAEWTNTNNQDRVYLQAKTAKDANHVLQYIRALTAEKVQQFRQETKPSYTYERQLQLMPLRDSHFSTHIRERDVDKTSKAVVYGLVAVAAFLLFLACINYINLTTAQMPLRHKEIGIRKTLGSSQKLLIYQILTETVLITVAALTLSACVYQAGIGLLGDLVKEEARNYSQPLYLILFMVALLGLTTLLSGLYPAWLVTKVNPTHIFRSHGSAKLSSQKLNFRRLLIVFQFVIAQFFIVGAILVGQQLNYTVQKDMGFDKDAVIISKLPFKLSGSENFNDKKTVLLQEIKQLAGVKAASLGNPPLEGGYRSSGYEYRPSPEAEPISVNVFKKYIDSTYFSLYSLELLAGSHLPPADTTNAFIINETAVRAFGFASPHDALGKIIGQKGEEFPVVGVVKDFHQQSFYQPIEAMALLSDKWSLSTYNIKLDIEQRKQWPQIIAAIESKWKNMFPNVDFEYSFYDDSIAALYKKEQQLHKLTNISTGIAILISCLGLFGLATLTAFQRSKEIGIRKVMGASVGSIVGMLSQDFVRIVLIATFIAAPLVWWAINKWLEDFVYRIDVSWYPFVLGGSIAIVAALLTVSYQAVKAARANPVDALRDE